MSINQGKSINLKDAYIERCEKESEELVALENNSFLNQGIIYFKNNLEEFMYMESDIFERDWRRWNMP